jgi:hypothetical protein
LEEYLIGQMNSTREEGLKLLEEAKFISSEILVKLKYLNSNTKEDGKKKLNFKKKVKLLQEKYFEILNHLSVVLEKLDNQMIEEDEELENKTQKLIQMAKEKDEEIKKIIKKLRELKYDIASFK